MIRGYIIWLRVGINFSIDKLAPLVDKEHTLIRDHVQSSMKIKEVFDHFCQPPPPKELGLFNLRKGVWKTFLQVPPYTLLNGIAVRGRLSFSYFTLMIISIITLWPPPPPLMIVIMLFIAPNHTACAQRNRW